MEELPLIKYHNGQEVRDSTPHHINVPLVSTTHSLHRHIHCVEGALENKVRIQLIHLLNELGHLTLSLVHHHKELHTLVCAKAHSNMVK